MNRYRRRSSRVRRTSRRRTVWAAVTPFGYSSTNNQGALVRLDGNFPSGDEEAGTIQQVRLSVEAIPDNLNVPAFNNFIMHLGVIVLPLDEYNSYPTATNVVNVNTPSREYMYRGSRYLDVYSFVGNSLPRLELVFEVEVRQRRRLGETDVLCLNTHVFTPAGRALQIGVTGRVLIALH